VEVAHSPYNRLKGILEKESKMRPDVAKKLLDKIPERMKKIDSLEVELEKINSEFREAKTFSGRWIGFKLTEELQRKYNKTWLSAGRVQIPVVGWIIDRYKQWAANKRNMYAVTLANRININRRMTEKMQELEKERELLFNWKEQLSRSYSDIIRYKEEARRIGLLSREAYRKAKLNEGLQATKKKFVDIKSAYEKPTQGLNDNINRIKDLIKKSNQDLKEIVKKGDNVRDNSIEKSAQTVKGTSDKVNDILSKSEQFVMEVSADIDKRIIEASSERNKHMKEMSIEHKKRVKEKLSGGDKHVKEVLQKGDKGAKETLAKGDKRVKKLLEKSDHRIKEVLLKGEERVREKLLKGN
jgi:hypothetical protein